MTKGFTVAFTGSGRLLLALLLAGVAPATWAQSQVYTVTIRPVLNDLDVRIDHVADSRMLVVNLENHSPTRVRCDIRFDASPQTPSRSTRNIDPGRRVSSVLRANRRWFSVVVDVVCTATPGASGSGAAAASSTGTN
jgi:hypothetical protein